MLSEPLPGVFEMSGGEGGGEGGGGGGWQTTQV